MIVTIDGPAGSGKSTAARSLAARLGFQFLDTGAMYRAVALACLQRAIDPEDERAVADLAHKLHITFSDGRILTDGRDVTQEIRTAEVTEAASVVAINPAVRRRMVQLQRKAAEGADFVTEGRDQGTIVFPDAQCKFFLTADPHERARRRQRELEKQGKALPVDEVFSQIQERDRRDENRSIGPLRPADDAIQIDTSQLDEEDVLSRLEPIVRQRLNRPE